MSSVTGDNPSTISQSPSSPQPSYLETFKRDYLPKIKEIAITAFKVLGGLALFVMNPTVFACGFIVGIIWDRQSNKTLNKIANIIKKQPFHILLVLGAASILCLQVTMGVSSFGIGSLFGSELSLHSQPDSVIKKV